MLIIVTSPSGSSTPSSRATLTVADILTRVTRDLQRGILGNDAMLVDWCDRAHNELCRLRTWEFLLSTEKRFITKKEQPRYWIGATGSNPAGSVDTGLNLTDVDYIDKRYVTDGTRFNTLTNIHDDLMVDSDVWRDTQSRLGTPEYWAYNEDADGIFQVYPAPDEALLYQPVAPAPLCVTTSGGALSGRYYSVMVTVVDSAGNESAQSSETTLYVPANYLLKVKSPLMQLTTFSSGITLDSFRVYAVSSSTLDSGMPTNSGDEVFQTGSTTTLGTDWTEPVGGLYTGTAAAPTDNNLEYLRGHVIQFRYYKKINTFTSSAAALQLPDDWRDVLVAGVNAFGYEYLYENQRVDAGKKAADWRGVFEAGKIRMIRGEVSRNFIPQFVGPDPNIDYSDEIT